MIGKRWYRCAIDPFDPENRIQFRKTLKILYQASIRSKCLCCIKFSKVKVNEPETLPINDPNIQNRGTEEEEEKEVEIRFLDLAKEEYGGLCD